jgi:hypothetical protein
LIFGWVTIEYPSVLVVTPTRVQARALENRSCGAEVRAENEIDAATDESRDGSCTAAQINQLDIKTMFPPDTLVGRDPGWSESRRQRGKSNSKDLRGAKRRHVNYQRKNGERASNPTIHFLPRKF